MVKGFLRHQFFGILENTGGAGAPCDTQRDNPPKTYFGGAEALKVRVRISSAGNSRRTAVGEVLSPSSRASMAYFGGATVTKC